MAAKIRNICNICNKRRAYTGTGPGVESAAHGSDMCNYCFTEGSWENSHGDNDHDNGGVDDAERLYMQDCWICHPKLNLAQKPAKQGNTGAKVQGDRRPQLNHKGHSHPATPAARRACKKAFWDIIKAGGDMVGPNLQAAMDKWDSHLDGFGKSVGASK